MPIEIRIINSDVNIADNAALEQMAVLGLSVAVAKTEWNAEIYSAFVSEREMREEGYFGGDNHWYIRRSHQMPRGPIVLTDRVRIVRIQSAQV